MFECRLVTKCMCKATCMQSSIDVRGRFRIPMPSLRASGSLRTPKACHRSLLPFQPFFLPYLCRHSEDCKHGSDCEVKVTCWSQIMFTNRLPSGPTDSQQCFSRYLVGRSATSNDYGVPPHELPCSKGSFSVHSKYQDQSRIFTSQGSLNRRSRGDTADAAI